mmetsp:Transcript_1567/g.3767  ORF Transcript_1567/g.3767 Transcript_1567/m.3767 type:complete len:162 (-) Transcript_1567:29-514(-)
MRWSSVALTLAWVAVEASAESDKLDAQACSRLGFASESLECKTCTRLRDAMPTGDQKGAADAEKLVANCFSCCQEAGNEGFARAVLYVCPSQVEVNQDVEDFVKRKADSFKNLKIKYVDGARTTLQLLREDETEEDSAEYVNIRGWKSDEIRDFLKLKVTS